MANKIVGNIEFENAKIIFKNFTGEPSKFNREGKRDFCVVISDPEMVSVMMDDGWNIKSLKPRDEEDEPTYYLPVQVEFNNFPPTVYMITKNNRVQLNEETINTLQYADIATIDLIVRPYTWEVNGKTGVKAYLKTMYVVINEDSFASKYAYSDSDIADQMPWN